MPRAQVAVLMSDTHAPLPLPSKVAALHFTALSALVNAHYACSHGYDLLYLRLTEATCQHHVYGQRHPSYCKLPAIAHALQRYSTVVFVDSDAWFTSHAPPLEELIHAGRRTAAASAEHDPSLFLAWDHPYSNGPNCGFMIWKNSTRAQRLLATWWHIDSGRFNLFHDYEQRTMFWRRGSHNACILLCACIQCTS